MSSRPSGASGVRAGRGYRWALVFPFVWQAVAAPLVNDVPFTPFGLPFPLAWQLAGIVLTSGVIAWVFHRDRSTGVEAEEAAFSAPPPSAPAPARR